MVDAGAGRRSCPQPLVRDLVAAHLAATVGALGDALQGGVDLGEVLLGLLDERADLGAIVEPSGSCSSSAMLASEASTTSANSRRSPVMRSISLARFVVSSAAWAAVLVLMSP